MLHYNQQLCELIHGNTKIITTLEHDIEVLDALIEQENKRTGRHVDPVHISYSNKTPIDQFDELLHALQNNYNQYMKLHRLPTKLPKQHKWLQFK